MTDEWIEEMCLITEWGHKMIDYRNAKLRELPRRSLRRLAEAGFNLSTALGPEYIHWSTK